MTTQERARLLFDEYDRYRVGAVGPLTCKHNTVETLVHKIVEHGEKRLALEEMGRSLEGRSINLVRCGAGRSSVLLWSQMHGDEPTATLALLDIFTYLATSQDEWVEELLNSVAIYALPMINPDGAERPQRETAVWVDMNRDARAQASPEAALLRKAHLQLQPEFAFNLHDQELSSAGTAPRPTALALLAPPADERRSMGPVRRKAVQVSAMMVVSLKQFVEGHLATYDDTHEPRAFGDGMQSWGTSTVLIEAGHWPGDRMKTFVRKLNAVAILSALAAIADRSYIKADESLYHALPVNGKRMFDVVLRNIWLLHPDGWKHVVDIGCAAEPANNRDTPDKPSRNMVVTVKEIGDLSTHGALETIEGFGRAIETSALSINAVMPLGALLDCCR